MGVVPVALYGSAAATGPVESMVIRGAVAGMKEWCNNREWVPTNMSGKGYEKENEVGEQRVSRGE